MPQVFQVLKCYQCSVFQVHQTKKSNKFECKMCGEKQSIKRHFGVGNGQECRIHVQKLNGMRGDIDGLNNSTDMTNSSDTEDDSETVKPVLKSYTSKWSDYIENDYVPNVANQNEDKMFLHDKEVVLELPSRKRQKRNDGGYIRHSKPSMKSRTNYQNTINERINLESVHNIENTVSLEVVHRKSNMLSGKNENLLPFNINTVKAESDTHKLCDITSNKAHKDTSKASNETKTKFIPSVNENSKWATFDNDEDSNESEEDLLSDIENIRAQNFTRQLFSLCDDDELDTFLDI